jgi:hypothetical protein
VLVERPVVPRDRVLGYLLRELTCAPELWIQKGYLTRVLTLGDQVRDEGIVPLEHFVDQAGPDAVAVAIEMDSKARIYPGVYLRTGGKVVEHVLPTHPTHAFDTDPYARELAARVTPLLG